MLKWLMPSWRPSSRGVDPTVPRLNSDGSPSARGRRSAAWPDLFADLESEAWWLDADAVRVPSQSPGPRWRLSDTSEDRSQVARAPIANGVSARAILFHGVVEKTDQPAACALEVSFRAPDQTELRRWTVSLDPHSGAYVLPTDDDAVFGEVVDQVDSYRVTVLAIEPGEAPVNAVALITPAYGGAPGAPDAAARGEIIVQGLRYEILSAAEGLELASSYRKAEQRRERRRTHQDPGAPLGISAEARLMPAEWTDLSAPCWWRNASLTPLENGRWRAEDTSDTAYQSLLAPVCRNIGGQGVVFTVRVEPVEGQTGACAVRLFVQDQKRQRDSYWGVALEPATGASEIQVNAYGAFGEVIRETGGYRVSVLAIIGPEEIVNVSAQIVPAHGANNRAPGPYWKGAVIVSEPSYELLSLADAKLRAIAFKLGRNIDATEPAP